MPTKTLTTVNRHVKSYRLVWLAEIEPALSIAPSLEPVLRSAFDRGYAKGQTAVKVQESPVLARALAAIRA